MLRFLDGPAVGVSLCCSRAPLYLRVVRDGNTWDAMDQPGDRPQDGETLYAYRRTADAGSIHYSGRDARGKRFGRTEQFAEYRLCEPQPDDATMRDAARWRGWAEARHRESKGE